MAVAGDKASTKALPWQPRALSTEAKKAIEVAALHANDRYLAEVIERYAFCPYAIEGRREGQTARYVVHADIEDIEPLLEIFRKVVVESEKQVVQVIMPLAEIGPQDWVRFCARVTESGHKSMKSMAVLAVAALHPELTFRRDSPAGLVPMLRRSPDPTIQWVRLDALDAIYAGRRSDDVYVDTKDIPAYLEKKETQRKPLYDQIADTNFSSAKRLGVEEVVEMLDDIRGEAKARYAEILGAN